MFAEKLMRVSPYAAASLLSLACGPDSTVAGGTAGTTGADEADCVEGEHGCACTPDDRCGGSMACMGGTCEHTPLPAPGPAPSELNPPGGAPCSTDADCSDVEVCDTDSECVHAWNVPWVITKLSIDPLGCPSNIAGEPGRLALAYASNEDFYNDKIGFYEEAPTTTGCPFVWENPTLVVRGFAGEYEGAHVRFQMHLGPESSPPTRIASWCWDSLHTGECGPVPAEFLAAGQLDAPDLHMEFARSFGE